MSVVSVTDGLMIEMLPVLPVVDERLPSVDRQSTAQWQMMPTATERPFSQSWEDAKDYREPMITYVNVCFKGSLQYPPKPMQYFTKGTIIDIWV